MSRRWLNRLRAWLARAEGDREMDEEIGLHLEMAVERYMAQGLPREAAERAARRDFGSVEGVRERHRDVRSVPWVDNLLRDLRIGARGLRRRPAMATTVMLALSLGIGLPALVFSLIDGAVLATLPFEGGDRIMRIESAGQAPIRQAQYEAWVERQRSFEAFGAVRNGTVTLATEWHGGEPVSAAEITQSILTMVTVEPALGRSFTAADAAPGTPAVVLLGERLWRERMMADPGVLGRVVRVNGRPAEIVGVMPAGFAFPWDQQLWTPMASGTVGEGALDPTRSPENLTLVGRLRPGMTARAAADELTRIAGEGDVERGAALAEPTRILVRGYTDLFSDPRGSLILAALLLGVALLVLLVACANIANVLLAHTAARRREVAVRAAVGASRYRIAGQLWAEVLLLAMGGAAGGVIIALAGTARIKAVMSTVGMPFWISVRLDPSALGFAGLLALLSAVAAGALPIVQASRANPHDLLKDEARGSTSFRLGRTMRRLIGVEIALSFVLLVGAGLFIRSAVNFQRTDFDFDPANVYTGRVTLHPEAPGAAVDHARFVATAHAGIAELPQVSGAALATAVPGIGSAPVTRVELDDAGRRGGSGERDARRGGGAVPASDPVGGPRARSVAVTPGYFALFYAAPRVGRDFLAADGPDAPPVAIVNREFAARYFPEGAVDRRIRLSSGADSTEWLTIVGVVPDLMAGGVEGTVAEAVYRPLAQVAPSRLMVLARSASTFGALPEPIRTHFGSVHPDLALFDIRAHDDAIAAANAQWKWLSVVFLVAGGVGLFLAAIGLYGVISFWVQQRTREIGVRVALGGEPHRILWLVLRQGLRQTAGGLAVGLLLAIPAARLLSSALYGVAPWDPMVFGAITAVLLAVACVGCWVPARRAIRVDPLTAIASDAR